LRVLSFILAAMGLVLYIAWLVVAREDYGLGIIGVMSYVVGTDMMRD
jgi:hypothetical protein